MLKNIQLKTGAVLAFIAGIAALRVGFSFAHSPLGNFTPIGAMALFGGAYFSDRWKAYILPLATLLISDLILNRFLYFQNWQFFYEGSGWTYAAFALMTLTGSLIRKINFSSFIGGVLVITLIHWIVTDIGVWQSSFNMYPKTFSGFVQCLVAAIPWELNFLAGSLIYGVIMFGSAEWMKQKSLFVLKTA